MMELENISRCQTSPWYIPLAGIYPRSSLMASSMACAMSSRITRGRLSSSNRSWPIRPQRYIPTVYTIVLFNAAAGLNLRAADHGTMILRDNAYSRSARDAFLDCIRAARVSSRALFIQLLVIIAIIGTIIAIIRKHRTATWIGI
jgi:hypothetical protein